MKLITINETILQNIIVTIFEKQTWKKFHNCKPLIIRSESQVHLPTKQWLISAICYDSECEQELEHPDQRPAVVDEIVQSFHWLTPGVGVDPEQAVKD